MDNQAVMSPDKILSDLVAYVRDAQLMLERSQQNANNIDAYVQGEIHIYCKILAWLESHGVKK